MRLPVGSRALTALAHNASSLERAIRRIPPLAARAERAAARYVAGPTRDEAFEVVDRLHHVGLAASLDLFGAAVPDEAEAARVADEYVELAKLTGDLPDGTWLAVDLSHLGLDVSADFCRMQLCRILEALPIGRWLQVSGEDRRRLDHTLDIVTTLAEESAPIAMTVAANLRRSREDAMRLAEVEVPIRLVKGDAVGSPSVATRPGEPTDVAFVRLASRLADEGAAFSIATHDRLLRETLLARLGPRPIEMRYGVQPRDATSLAARGVPVRLYVPYGPGWFRYWVRQAASEAA